MSIGLVVRLADTWGMHGDDVGTGWMIMMVVFMVLFWAAVILGIVWLARGSLGGWRGGGPETPGGRRETPTEILERRFAEGVISVDDYDQRRKIIARGTDRGHEAHGGQ